MDVYGTVDTYQEFASRFISVRRVDVWLPPGYDPKRSEGYPVLYMHDGQNLFDPALAYIGIDWGIDEAVVHLVEADKIPPTLVVGIWNTPDRMAEYLPQQPVSLLSPAKKNEVFVTYGSPKSDAYLLYLVEELKPFVDANYRTRAEREGTFLMGSSMGGLISLYAICEHPDVFAGAGCLSTHWPVVEGVMLRYLEKNLPDPVHHRLYFDYGSETLDATYEPHQLEVDRILEAAGYAPGENWITRSFPGAEHSEAAWRERVDIPLEFLLGALLDRCASSHTG
jgi:predicted alpha/beta superfamily hydrolase